MQQPSLAEIQRDFFASLLLPLRGRSRRLTELPSSDEPHSSGFFGVARRHIRPSPTLEPAECLELYHRQYWFRLLDSIEEDFPGVARLLGPARFWEIIEAYLLAHPSGSFTLRHLGRRLPTFLHELPLEAEEARRAVSVARIEYAVMECFEAPALPSAPAEHMAAGEFTLQPHVKLLELAANASEWLHDPDTPWSDGGGRRFHAAVWRTPSGSVRHTPLDAGAYRMLSRLIGVQTTLDAWLEASSSDLPEASVVSEWFATWSRSGWFAVPSPSTSPSP